MAGDVALEAAADLAVGLAFGAAAGEVSAGLAQSEEVRVHLGVQERSAPRRQKLASAASPVAQPARDTATETVAGPGEPGGADG